MTQNHRTTKRVRGLALGILALVAASLPSRAHSQSTATANASVSPPTAPSTAPLAPLASRVEAVLRTAHLGNAHVGFVVTDAATGAVLLERNAREAFNPASNAKLVTAAAALAILGADHRFTTSLAGRVEGRTVRDGLVVRGGGDPSLSTGDLYVLARTLVARGIDRIEGGIVVDDRAFGTEHLPPAFDQQPRESAPFRAAVSAASVDENVIALHIVPALVDGAPATISVEPADYTELDGAVRTVAHARPSVTFDAINIASGRERVRIGGEYPLGAPSATYRRRLENPSLATGYALRTALLAAGIRVAGNVRVDPTTTERAILATHESEPLSTLLYRLGKDSDNFYAEMTLLAIGAADHPTAMTFEHANDRVRQWLSSVGIDTTGLRVRNGSGLFDANRISPAQLAAVMRVAYRDPAIRDEYIAQLAVAGDDGTLAHRIDMPGVDRWVRAKTGTLDDAIALSGFVLSGDPGRTLIFSVLTEGVHGRHADARRLVDGIARELVREQQRGGSGS